MTGTHVRPSPDLRHSVWTTRRRGTGPKAQGRNLLGPKGQTDVKCMSLGVVKAGVINLGVIEVLTMA